MTTVERRRRAAVEYSRGSFLTRLTTEQYDDLLGLGEPVAYPADHTIVEQGPSTPPLLLLHTGFVKAVRHALKASQPAVVDVYGPGDILGAEAAHADKRAHTAFVTSRAVTANLVPPRRFMAYLSRHPAVLWQLTTTFANRVRQREAALAYSRHEVLERLVGFLTRQQAIYGITMTDGDLIDMGLSHRDIAAAIGASEAAVDDALRRLRTDGYISTGYKKIWVRRQLSDELRPVLRPGPTPPKALG